MAEKLKPTIIYEVEVTVHYSSKTKKSTYALCTTEVLAKQWCDENHSCGKDSNCGCDYCNSKWVDNKRKWNEDCTVKIWSATLYSTGGKSE